MHLLLDTIAGVDQYGDKLLMAMWRSHMTRTGTEDRPVAWSGLTDAMTKVQADNAWGLSINGTAPGGVA
jgi:hypothetical protein